MFTSLIFTIALVLARLLRPFAKARARSTAVAAPDAAGDAPVRAAGLVAWAAPELPEDPAIPDLQRVFHPEYMARAYRTLFGEEGEPPDSIRPLRFTYRPGRRALVGYCARWTHGQWQLEQEFACEAIAGKKTRLFRYPDDPHLPGLAASASPDDAQALLARYASVHPDTLRIQTVRYRPSTRAVLRYSVGWRGRGDRRAELYVRAMRPSTVDRFVRAGMLAARSRFRLPSLKGRWDEGGVVWLGAMPGRTVRERILRGRGPDPDRILDCLESLWALEAPAETPISSLPASLRWTEEFLGHLLHGRPGAETLAAIARALDPLAVNWAPSGVAHNDFYDDQVLVLRGGGLGLVDFEECGLGDQMVDVANMLAHLRWSSHFGRRSQPAAYRTRFRERALARTGWAEADLDAREAYALLRLCTNPVRSLRPDWAEVTEQGLALVAEILGIEQASAEPDVPPLPASTAEGCAAA